MGLIMMMKKKTEIQLVKFGLIGFFNTALDFGIFALLSKATDLLPEVSHVISYSCGVINSYFWNRTWTFHKKGRSHPMEFAKFVLVNFNISGDINISSELLKLRSRIIRVPRLSWGQLPVP
ncbi:MAG: GtrA family protein [Caldicoprobacterales bacterium]